MGFSVKGIEDVTKRLDRLAKKAEALEGTNTVSFDELFTQEFMSDYTNFHTFGELLTAGGYEVRTQEDFEAISEDNFDRHIASVTDFSSWEEMQQQAVSEYVQRRLFS